MFQKQVNWSNDEGPSTTVNHCDDVMGRGFLFALALLSAINFIICYDNNWSVRPNLNKHAGQTIKGTTSATEYKRKNR